MNTTTDTTPTAPTATAATTVGTATTAATAATAASTPRLLVLRYFAALADGDQDTIRDCWAEDGSVWYPGDLPISGTWQGRDQVIDGFLGTAFAHFDPAHEVGLQVTNVFDQGEQVLIEWHSWGVGKTGRTYDQKNIAVFVVRDEKIVTMREYADTQHWARALVA
ncbi:nuclear transport factor 2 family protein [Catenulispora sp. NF23]|uniref:Nuclear transport factor 2 family protein n=1 Tax=Catenulispora pinistramenti TaxID=2705254 RepID=A0ABS5KJW0_9ACTN|nr:nuclear transport factor 2 family protein [Catenulispora pinistramenti]MBS2532612.1 nuclear transport factor 2 family protein [Catenulispora pinistramenti]MBS2546280.1 nuclear transport factor 2 family protein [Catenulispora pinistramenti]